MPIPVAHGRKYATEGFIQVPIRIVRVGAFHPTHRFAAAFRVRNEPLCLQDITMRSLTMNRWNPSQTDRDARIDVGLPIFVSPAATLAICVMVFGVLHAVATLRIERVAIDGLFAVNALLYVAAALLAHAALRVRASMRCVRLSRYANNFSIAALSMTIVGTCCVVLLIALQA
jgi:hypothetical protein